MFWNKDINEIKDELNTDLEQGLTQSQAANLLRQNGLNQLPTSKKKSIFSMIIEHLLEPFTFVLLALLIISAIFRKWPEVGVIVLIVALEMFLTILQERKAMNSLDSVKQLVKENAVVIREGKKYTIDAKNLVVGDLVYLESGMFLPADIRITKSFNLKVNESLLTGESNLIAKTPDVIDKETLAIGDRVNMVFMSTIIASGSGLGIVTAVGKDTEIGKITTLLQDEKEPMSPLDKQIVFLIRTICIFALFLGIFIFCIQYFVSGANKSDETLVDALMFTVALVIAVIPEGLNVIVTVSLSLGSRRMAKKNAIVKQLTAVETLGQVNVICSDKTGTLTENKMTVTKFFLKESISSSSSLKLNSKQEKLFLEALILDNNSSINDSKIIGDPTEGALLKWAQELNIDVKDTQVKYDRIHELSFDSDRKLMSTINNYNEKQMVFTKGAPDQLVEHCTHYLLDDKKYKITAAFKKELNQQLQAMSTQALRVLGAAYKEHNPDDDINNLDKIENNLIFLGLVGMIDPPRKEVKDVLVNAKAAGINTKMITGDHLNTAVAVGKELGILKDEKQAISGDDIERLTDKQLKKSIEKYQVFARVSPEHKVRVVRALQAKNNIVSMTGDGVNDAPSLKAANIGVAMGITGTDVAKEAAQVVLADDNFITIIDAIEEGRNIFNKLKRIICFIFITNLSQVFAIIVATFLKWENILTPLQVLWINLIVESFLSITMSMGANNPQLMKDKPISKNENILRGSWKFIFFASIITSAILLLIYKFLPLALGADKALGPTYAFVFMSNAPVFYSLSFAVGSRELIVTNMKMLFKNKTFLVSVLISFVINAMIVFIPGLNSAFNIHANISFVAWLCCFALALIPTILLGLFKIVFNFTETKVKKFIEIKFPKYAKKKASYNKKKNKKVDKMYEKRRKKHEKSQRKIDKIEAKISKKKKKKKKKVRS